MKIALLWLLVPRLVIVGKELILMGSTMKWMVESPLWFSYCGNLRSLETYKNDSCRSERIMLCHFCCSVTGTLKIHKSIHNIKDWMFLFEYLMNYWIMVLNQFHFQRISTLFFHRDIRILRSSGILKVGVPFITKLPNRPPLKLKNNGGLFSFIFFYESPSGHKWYPD